MSKTCPACSTSVAVKEDGTLRRHVRDGQKCLGAEPMQAIPLTIIKPLTQNQVRRMHPLVEARAKKELITEARWAIRAAKPTPVPVAEVTLHYRPGTRRLCDSDGLAPTLKCVLDALVHEGILRDDTYLQVPKSGVHIHPPQAGMPASTWVELTAVEEGL